MLPIINSLSNVILQLNNHLEKITDSDYSEKLNLLNQATIGEHVRHIYNFPECLFNGLKSTVVNYEKRVRNHQLEVNRQYAIEALSKQENSILSLSDIHDLPLILEFGNGNRIETSLKRELHYITEHTIHHMAIIRIGMIYLIPEMEIESSFGVAASTIEYKQKLAMS